VGQYANNIKAMKTMLDKLIKELDRRMALLDATPWVDVDEYNKKQPKKDSNAKPFPSVLLVIDELAEIHDDGMIQQLQRLIKQGRSHNIHIVAFLQRACSKEMISVLKSQFGATLVGRVKNRVNGQIFLDDDGSDAANISVDTPGRFVFWTTKIMDVQVPWLSADGARKIMKEYSKADVVEQPTVQLTIQPAILPTTPSTPTLTN
jgi:hypothetical protein